MKYYAEAQYSICADLLGGVMVGPVRDEGVEVLVFVEDEGITVGVRLEATGYAAALPLLAFYAGRAARSIQMDDLPVPEPYRLTLYDSAALDAHYWFQSELAADELP